MTRLCHLARASVITLSPLSSPMIFMPFAFRAFPIPPQTPLPATPDVLGFVDSLETVPEMDGLLERPALGCEVFGSSVPDFATAQTAQEHTIFEIKPSLAVAFGNANLHL